MNMFLPAVEHDFNDQRGVFTVKHPGEVYGGRLEVGDQVIFYEPEDGDLEASFGCIVTVTKIERSHYEPARDIVYTDYGERHQEWRDSHVSDPNCS